MIEKWNEMNSFSFEISKSLGVLCVGSCEQHSDYLPLGTDSMLGEKIAEEAAKNSQCKVIMLPPQRIGYSPHHRSFRGYITISQEVMFSYLIEVCLCAYENGLEKLLILNSHGGNQSCLQTIVNELGSVYGKKTILVRYWDLIGKAIEKIRETDLGGIGHAGELETSLMLYYYPEFVDKSKICEQKRAKGNEWHHPDMFSKNKVYIYKSFDEYSIKGNIGQPQYANVEKGKLISSIIVKELSRLMDDYWSNNF